MTTEDKLTRAEELCFLALLYLSIFWRWLTNSDPWEETKTEKRLFWGVVIIAVPVGYLMLSGLCAIGADCTLANADFFLWLFS